MNRIPFLALLLLLFCSGLALSEEEKPEQADAPVYDLRGSWKVLLSNSLSRKQVTFVFDEHEDGMLRGYLTARGTQELKVDGRFEEDEKKIFVWGRYVERTGQSFEYEFRGKVEGEPGNEKLVGKADFFEKRFKFVGVRGKKRKKKKKS